MSNYTNPGSNRNREQETINTVREDTNDISYRDGYLQGRDVERRIYRDDTSEASGLLVGILLATIAGIVVGSIFYVMQRNDNASRVERPTQIVPVPVPNNSQPQTNNKETTIIERTVNRTREVVPVPEKAVPASPIPAPNVNINIPNPLKQEASDSETKDSQTETKASDSETKVSDSESKTDTSSTTDLNTQQ